MKPEEKEKYWHSASHIMAAAVKKIFPDVRLGIGPAIENGFYYDFDGQFTEEDFKRIEDEMKKIIKKDLPFEKKIISKEEARKLFADEKYKLELIDELPEDRVSIYKLGDFVDLCKGPHVASSGKICVVKLLKIAGAYWRGDSKQPMLQRIYGIAFESKKELDEFLRLRKEAERRDHRKLGVRLDLFSFHEEAPGMAFFHPKGMIVVNALIDFWRREHVKRGYQEVRTPFILNRKLWEQSGHWDHYKENMYFTKIDDVDVAVKPMNCPGGILIYKTKLRSYKDLPLKLSELGVVHRHELSGVLSGLFRVRSFIQDDAHVFCLPEQIRDEIIKIIDLTDYIYKVLGFDYEVKLSTRPESSIGSDEMWEIATNALKDALRAKKIKYDIDEGEGVFYGPKIDFHLEDCLGRTWQCGTIQLDFAMPERFDLSYVGEDGKPHRTAMIHRTIYGSIERFVGILVEHYAGAFPLWLAPVQVAVLPVTDRNINYAKAVESELVKNDIRAEGDYEPNTIEYKIRNAQLQKIPYTLVVGDKEEKNKTVALRGRDGKVMYGVKLKDFTKKVFDEVENKR